MEKATTLKQKQRVLYTAQTNYLFDHILGGFEGNVKGLQSIRNKLLTEEEYTELLEKAATHLINRIREYKIMNGLVSIFFAVLFTTLQITGNVLDMRRVSRRSGSKKHDYELVEEV